MVDGSADSQAAVTSSVGSAASSQAQPCDVSVIIPTYNDAKHLKAAIASVATAAMGELDVPDVTYEVIVADDGSTDKTLAMLQKLPRDRLVVIALSPASGAAGAPRNHALERARGEYVTMLDSDDVLLPHALARLVAIARQTGDDLVLGATQRKFMLSGRTARWMPQHYRTARHADCITDAPDLVGDTNSTAILYSREFFERTKLRYRESVRYEDLDFTTSALVLARGIDVIPDVVYEWRIYPPRVRRSITQQREDATSLLNRLAALDAIDGFLAEQSAAVQTLVRDSVTLKFLRHDAFVYLGDAMRIDDELLEQYIALLAPRIRAASAAQRATVSPMKQVALAEVLNAADGGGLDGVRLATQYDRGLGGLGGCVVSTGEGASAAVTWASRVDRPSTATVIWPVLDTPSAAIPILHYLNDVKYTRHSVTIHGQSWVPWMTADAVTDVTLTWRRYEEREAFAIPITWQPDTVDTCHATWTATFDIPRGLPLHRPNRYDAWITLATHRGTNASRIRTHLAADPRQGAHSPGMDAFLGRRYGLFMGGLGVLGMKKVVKHRYGTQVQNAVAVGLAKAVQWLVGLVHRRPAVARYGALVTPGTVNATHWIGDLALADNAMRRACPDAVTALICASGETLPRRKVIVLEPEAIGAAKRHPRVQFNVAAWRERYGTSTYLIVDRRGLDTMDANYGPPIRRVDAPYIWEIGNEGLAAPSAAELASVLGVAVTTTWPDCPPLES